MLPLPSIDFIPKIFKDDLSAKAMTNKIDTHLEQWKSDILALASFIRVDECPSWAIAELGFLLNAGIKSEDLDATKRIKVHNAIETQKLRSTFKFDVKKRIDAITFQNSAMVHQFDTDEWVLMSGAETSPAPSTYYWATMGNDGGNNLLGLWPFALGTEYPIAGNILIDCHQGETDPILTPNQIQAIVDDLSTDNFPAYYKIVLGYFNFVGTFTVYTTIG